MKQEPKKELIDYWREEMRKHYVPTIIIFIIFVIITIGIYFQAIWAGEKLEKEMQQKKKDKQEQLK